jgi:FlaA1/EpsC-like NDP-sugar epimerase
VVIAMPAATRQQRRRALELAAGTGLPVLTVPSADELRTGQTRVERLRDIEPEDLLGRESVVLDEAASRRRCRARPCSSPVPAAASAVNCAARWRASARRGWCCTN